MENKWKIDDYTVKTNRLSNEWFLNEDQSLGCTGSTNKIKETDHCNDDRDAESYREPSGVFHFIPPVDSQITMMFLKVIEPK